MSRVKTQEELDQEARDEALARQLQMEADQSEARQAQQQQQQLPQRNPQQTFVAPPEQQQMYGSLSSSSIPQLNLPHVRCTKCNAINTVQPAKLHLQQICGQCQKLLPPIGGTGPRTNVTPSSPSPPQQQQQQQPGGFSSVPSNAFPPGFGGDPNLAQGGASNSGILQGQVQTQQVQARCGQCQSINALPVPNREPGQTISFRCGQCQAVNRVTM